MRAQLTWSWMQIPDINYQIVNVVVVLLEAPGSVINAIGGRCR